MTSRSEARGSVNHRLDREIFRRKFCLFPKHDGRGNVIVEYQDGSSETISLMDGFVQEEAWRTANRGAAVYLAMVPRKP